MSNTVGALDALVFGTNHRQSSLELRERIALTDGDRSVLLRRICDELPNAECFALSTCNRTEVYVLGVDPTLAAARVRSLLSALKDIDFASEGVAFYELNGRAAIAQIHRVACGIDSQMLGELQILQQVQECWEFAARTGTAGALTDRLLDNAMRCGRRARAETAISHGAMSVAFAAVSVAHKVFGNLVQRAALVVGAGATGALAARHLRDHHVGRLLIANRTIERARTVAGELRGEPIALDAVTSALAQVDIVITATSAPQPLLDVAVVQAAMKARHHAAFLIVDIGVPRDVASQVRHIDNVFLHDLDGLQVMIDQTHARRRREVPRVEQVVETEVDRYYEWFNGLRSAPLICELRSRMEVLRDEELARHSNQWTAAQRQAAEEALRGLVNKLLHRPTTLVRHATAHDALGRRRLDAVRDVFGLAGSETVRDETPGEREAGDDSSKGR